MPVVPCSAAVWMLPGMILLVFTKASTLNVKFSLGLPFGVCLEAAKWLFIVLSHGSSCVSAHAHSCLLSEDMFLKIFVHRFYVQGWGVMYFLELFLLPLTESHICFLPFLVMLRTFTTILCLSVIFLALLHTLNSQYRLIYRLM